MLVRLAFAVMVQADADILLIDEVLAVGDAAFQQKCADVVPRDARRGQDDRPRHPRHGRGRGLLPPGDADPRRRASRTSATPRRSARATTCAQLRAARADGAAPSERRGAGRRRARHRRLARGRGGRAGDERRAGRADPAPGRDRGARATLPSPSFGFVTRQRRRGRRLRLRHAGSSPARRPRYARSRASGSRVCGDDREPARSRAATSIQLLGRPQPRAGGRRPARPTPLDFVVYGTGHGRRRRLAAGRDRGRRRTRSGVVSERGAPRRRAARGQRARRRSAAAGGASSTCSS